MLTRHWRELGINLDNADFTDTQAIASIARMTGENFRLLHRLFVQIERIMKINELSAVTVDVVEAARSTLVIGVTLKRLSDFSEPAFPARAKIAPAGTGDR